MQSVTKETLAEGILREWKRDNSTDIVEMMLSDGYWPMDFEPADPTTGIQKSGWCDFVFKRAEYQDAMEMLFNLSESTYHFVHDYLLSIVNDEYNNEN